MHYDSEYSNFYGLLQMLLGSSITKVLRDPAHFGQVVSELTEKSKYSPSQGLCNFTIPSVRTLHKLDIGYKKEIPCGFINHTLEMFQETAQNNRR